MKRWKKIFKTETRKLLRTFSHPTFLYLTVTGNGILFLAATAVYFLESGPDSQIKSYFDSLWWGVSTITTVGYGDILPQTSWGRLIGIALMYTGTVLFISFTGVLMTVLTKDEVEEEIAPLKKEMRKEEKGQEKIEALLEEISGRLERLENARFPTGQDATSRGQRE